MNVFDVTQVVLENSCRSDDHDLPFAQASIALTNTLCEILKVGEPRKSLFSICMMSTAIFLNIILLSLCEGWPTLQSFYSFQS